MIGLAGSMLLLVSLQEITAQGNPVDGGRLSAVWESITTTAQTASAPSLYSVGDPTDEEQLYLEKINRARANPLDEARRLVRSPDPFVMRAYQATGVDLARMEADLGALAAAQPLALNANMSRAARLHSQDMLANRFQGHAGSDGLQPDDRLEAQGYFGDALGENVYSNAHAVEDGHASFEVDWGGPAKSGGMQDPPWHRLNIHEPVYQEIGIGVVHGTNDPVGPQLVTQDFGYKGGVGPFITGVAYYDLDGDGFYSVGEGLGGVTVSVKGAGFYARSASSGGYAIPVGSDGDFEVTFSMTNAPDMRVHVVVTNDHNAKLDLVPAYIGSTLSGSPTPAIKQPNIYTFSPVPGATRYQWKVAKLLPVSGIVEGAEEDLSSVDFVTSSGYPAIEDHIVGSGRHSFHLAHPQPVSQVLSLNRVFRIGAGARLLFESQLGFATTGQVAAAQISVNRGRSWQNVWSQVGSGDGGPGHFTTRSVDLAPFAQKDAMFRFRYDVVGMSFYNQTSAGTGFYLDDIALVGAAELAETITDVPDGASFVFQPDGAFSGTLSVRGGNGSHLFDWGPERSVEAQSAPPQAPLLQIVSIQRRLDGSYQLECSTDHPGALSLGLQSAAELRGPWQTEAGTIENVGPAGQLRAVVKPGPFPVRFFRLTGH